MISIVFFKYETTMIRVFFYLWLWLEAATRRLRDTYRLASQQTRPDESAERVPAPRAIAPRHLLQQHASEARMSTTTHAADP